MADDLDWHEIIAPGTAAGQRAASTDPATSGRDSTDGAQTDGASAPTGDGAPVVPSADPARQHRSRREAREAAAAEGRGRRGVTDDTPAAADPEPPQDPEPRQVEIHELLAAETPSDGSGGDVPAGGGGGGDGRGSGGGAGRGGRGRASRPPREPRRKRSRGAVIAGIVIVAVVVVGGVGAATFVVPKVQSIAAKFTGKTEPTDYTGSGHGTATITIKEGDIGQDVAKTLERDDVVKSSGAFYKLLLASPDVQFQPGSYKLKKQMSSKAALSALQDAKNKVTASILIQEGAVLKDVEASMVAKAGLSQADVEAAANDVSAYGLPAGTTSLEGWLFPATYPVNPSWTAKQYFQYMVTTMYSKLDAAGVPVDQRAHVVTFAALIQKEAGLAADYPKVARVFQNRIDQGMPLQSDATVAYGTGHTDRVTTTDAERADASDPYNTYQHLGLPPGPISNPGTIAIDAAMHPADGSWLYFVTVNLDTGETTFSDTYAEHQVAVKQFQSWLRAHPDYQ